MSVYGYVGWPTNVNKIILQETTPKIGDGALKQDTLESGLKRGHLRNSYVPDVYNVVMDFNWEEKDENGESEYTRFLKWYKYVHKYGVKPFEFPQILYSPETGILIADEASNNYRVEYYKITSSLPGKKRGPLIQVNMTWVAEYSGVVQVEEAPEAIRSLSADKNHCEIVFSAIGNTEPVSNYFSIEIDNVPTEILGYNFGNYVARVFYAPLKEGNHQIKVTYMSSVLSKTVYYDFIV